VYLNGTLGGNNRWTKDKDPGLLLQKDNAGYWSGFLPEAAEGDPYKFYVVGTGGRGYKRDPYARELSFDPPFPLANCLLRDPGRYVWHDQGFVAPLASLRYDLSKLRAKGLVEKLPISRRYRRCPRYFAMRRSRTRFS